MTGWMFLAFLITAATSGVGGTLFGAQWVRDDIAAQERFAAELDRRQQAEEVSRRQPVPRLPLYVAVPDTDAQRRRNAAMREHPAGGSR